MPNAPNAEFDAERIDQLVDEGLRIIGVYVGINWELPNVEKPNPTPTSSYCFRISLSDSSS